MMYLHSPKSGSPDFLLIFHRKTLTKADTQSWVSKACSINFVLVLESSLHGPKPPADPTEFKGVCLVPVREF